MLQPFARFRERFFLFRCNWFVVDGSVSDGAGEGIEHGFEQPNDGGELRWRKPLDPFVGLLFLPRGTVCHEYSLTLRMRCLNGGSGPVLRLRIHPIKRHPGQRDHHKHQHAAFRPDRPSGDPARPVKR